MNQYEALLEESVVLLARVDSGEPLRELAEEAKSLDTRWRSTHTEAARAPKALHTHFESNLRKVFSARNAAWAHAAECAQLVVAQAANLQNWEGRIFTHYAADLRDEFFASGDIGPTRKTLRAELEEAIAAAFSTLPRRSADDNRAGEPDEETLAAAANWAALEHANGGRRRR
jgi:hypothetical protein